MPWGKVNKAKSWPWLGRGSCQTSPRRRAIRPHLAWAHPRGITPSMHRQYYRRLKSLPHAPSSRADYPSTSFCWLYYGDKHTLGMETTQPWAVQWDNRSTRALGRLPDTNEPLHQRWHDSMLCLPIIPQGSNIDLVWWMMCHHFLLFSKLFLHHFNYWLVLIVN